MNAADARDGMTNGDAADQQAALLERAEKADQQASIAWGRYNRRDRDYGEAIEREEKAEAELAEARDQIRYLHVENDAVVREVEKERYEARACLRECMEWSCADKWAAGNLARWKAACGD